MDSKERTAFIYSYTEKWLSGTDRSIDIVTDKLTKILAFSGVLLKFAADMEVNPDSAASFIFKFAVVILLMACIGLCAAGIWPRQRSESSLRPSYFVKAVKKVETATCEQLQEAAIEAWLLAIPEQEELRDFRVNYLNFAIACSVLAGLTFGVGSIVSLIH